MVGEKLSIDKKLCLSINEACEYSGIGEKSMRRLASATPGLVLHVGNKQLIKRSELDKLVAHSDYI